MLCSLNENKYRKPLGKKYVRIKQKQKVFSHRNNNLCDKRKEPEKNPSVGKKDMDRTYSYLNGALRGWLFGTVEYCLTLRKRSQIKNNHKKGKKSSNITSRFISRHFRFCACEWNIYSFKYIYSFHSDEFYISIDLSSSRWCWWFWVFLLIWTRITNRVIVTAAVQLFLAGFHLQR